MSIQALNISKRFGQFAALDNVDLEIPSGELVALLGPSGSGKTTLLRIIAGLEFADAGTVRFDGKDISDRTARERRVGFVFQHYALFRHMTVFENIAFGLKVRPRQHRPSQGTDSGQGAGFVEAYPVGYAGPALSVTAFRRTTAASGVGTRAGR